jgi:ABC-type uncharacterized transport system substrate-binding protein
VICRNFKFAFAAAAMLVLNSALVDAQPQGQRPRIGYLRIGGPASVRDEAFFNALRELGYYDGKNIDLEIRGDPERRLEQLPVLAADLVRSKPDVIVALEPPAARVAKKATQSIPIVVRTTNDPVEEGIVASLAHPGGNITGVYSVAAELTGKRLELLMQTVPRLARVGLLWNPDYAAGRDNLKNAETSAKSLGLRLQLLQARTPDSFEAAFRSAVGHRAQALIALRSPLIVSGRRRLAELAIKSRLPAIYDDREFVEAGGLMSYGTNLADLYRRAVFYVDKILKGAKPADLPVEQPTKFELVINLKAAKQIGLTIPPNVLARADKVIR